ncbi:MAG: helix-turn-helix domain-containing protein [Ornithinimicrobium sp.]|uniref:putative transposase n=1 Tax=Ornithinimicrobium sp. TaxID=1977084 RepID=UPI0026DF9524|nr:helix-turn-helix domain-containing protein [Ornithinimicrobium sp.]MDO5740828.1 helix-turn-helix domain-containing protein [Ornithinimicrobium sp.]
MTAQAPLPLVPADAVDIGAVAALVEGDDGSGQVYVRGELAYLWGPGDRVGRRLAAVQLMAVGAASGAAVAAGFGIDRETLRQWTRAMEASGTAGLLPGRPGPKGPSKLTPARIAQIRALREAGGSLRAVAEAADVSTDSVRRALAPQAEDAEAEDGEAEEQEEAEVRDEVVQVPVLAVPVARAGERSAARAGLLAAAEPVFTPAGRVPLAGLLLSLPALGATGLLDCAKDVYGALPDGFYGLDTMLLEGVFRALAGEPRAEGAARFAPADLGRVLGMDRAPEVKTVRRKIAQLATQERAADLLAALAAHHLHRPTLPTGDSEDGNDGDAQAEVGMVLYVDGHVRAYTGTRKIAKTHLSRLRFPAPATVETWVSDAEGDPVLVVMAEPGASLAGELRRLLPRLRAAVGDDRRVLAGFDRGGWSPALFAHMHAAGFDVLTWRKGPAHDVPVEEFTDVTLVDEAGREHVWRLADTVVDLPLGSKDEQTGKDELFTMRQVTRLDTKKGITKQVHVLTTRTDLDPAQVIYRMGSRWRQENYFRYARTHLGLDAHDSYAAHEDDPDRSVPNPAKRAAHKDVANARARAEREKARAQAGLLAARTPGKGSRETRLDNRAHDAITSPWHAAQDDLVTARAVHAQVPTRVRLGDLAPGQQVLDTETKLVHHAIRMAAFNTTTTIARDIRISTGYARAAQEAYTLTRQVLTRTGDILPDPHAATLTIRLDPMPTARETSAVAELCEHLTATATTYPGTELRLRYEIKSKP